MGYALDKTHRNGYPYFFADPIPRVDNIFEQYGVSVRGSPIKLEHLPLASA